MKVIVTGSDGYIGRAIVKEIMKEEGNDVFDIDVVSGRDIFNFMVPGSIGYQSLVSFGADAIIHTAAVPRIQNSIENPHFTFKANTSATEIALEFARMQGIKKFIFSSSSSAKFPEKSPYAMQKKMSEMLVKMYRDKYKIEGYSLRYFNVYSEFKDFSKNETLISIWLNNVLKKKTSVIYGDGNQRRDMIHLKDVVSANLKVLSNDFFQDDDIIEIGTGTNISVNEIKDLFLKYFDFQFIYGDERPGEVKESISNESKWSTVGIIDGVSSVIEELLSGMDNKNDCKDKILC